eukprot:m51a1_g12727 putative atp binding protein (859) ;mRNA; f:146-3379
MWNNPNGFAILHKWAGESSAAQLPQLAATLLRMSEGAIAKLYDAVEHPPPLRLSNHRLHALDGAVEVPLHRTLTKYVTVTNGTARPVLLRVEHAPLALGDGFQLHCWPRVFLCPENMSRNLRLDFTVTNEAALAQRGSQIYMVTLYYAEVTKNGATKSTGRETPYVIPFTVKAKNYGKVAPAAQEFDVAGVFTLPAQEYVSIIDNTVVEKVAWSGITCARKCLRLPANAQELIPVFKKEIRLLDAARHPNLASVVGYASDATRFVLLTPICSPIRTLRDFVCLNDPLPYPLRIKVAIDVALGIKQMHHFGVVFGDLRPESVSIVSNDFDYVKIDGGEMKVNAVITDIGHVVGYSALAQVRDRATDSIPYTAPEVTVSGASSKSPASDVYSFSMLLYLLSTRVLPYSDTRGEWNTTTGLLEAVGKGTARPNVALVHRDWPKPLVALMQQCWSQTPGQRPSVDNVIDALQTSLYPFTLLTDEWKSKACPPLKEQPIDDTLPPKELSASPVTTSLPAAPGIPQTGPASIRRTSAASLRDSQVLSAAPAPAAVVAPVSRGSIAGLPQMPPSQQWARQTEAPEKSCSDLQPAVASDDESSHSSVSKSSSAASGRSDSESHSSAGEQPLVLGQRHVAEPAELEHESGVLEQTASEQSEQTSSVSSSASSSDSDSDDSSDDDDDEWVKSKKRAAEAVEAAEAAAAAAAAEPRARVTEAIEAPAKLPEAPAEAPVTVRIMSASSSAASPASARDASPKTSVLSPPGAGDTARRGSFSTRVGTLSSSVVVRVVPAHGGSPTSSVRISRTCVSAQQFTDAIRRCLKAPAPADAVMTDMRTRERVTDEWLKQNLVAAESPMDITARRAR